MPTFRTRLVVPAFIGLFAMFLAGVVLVTPAFGANTDVRINEFSSNSPDFVELVNTGGGTVDLTGWVLKDNSENNSYTFPAGSSIAAGAIKGISGENVEFAFGLGNGDSVRLFAPGNVLIDSFDYPSHPPAGKSYGRCPDGSGPIGITQAATKGAPNSCTTPNTAVKINEFSSNNPDFVELVNTGGGTVDLTGWVLKDNSENNSYTFPAGSSIAAGAIKGISGENVEFAFGLGNGDSVRLFAPGNVLIDSFDYPSHPPAGKSYGRCPNGTGSFVITAAATKGASNSCPLPTGAADIKVNEVRSDPDDIVELTNIGTAAVNIGGFILKDNDDTHVFTIPAGTSLPAGGFVTFDVNPAYGLGKGDSVRLYTPDGATLLDSTTYPADTHATTWGRCPDGTGPFAAQVATLGAANQCGPVVPVAPNVTINEIESNGDQVADWVELKNNGTAAVNISGWKILDNDPAHVAAPVVVPANTSIPAGGYYAIYTEIAQSPGFGLGGADSVTVFLADGTTQVDTYAWTVHAATTYGRCPDGTGSFTTTTTSTRGLANACSPVRINEVESNLGTPGDWIELKNISAAPANVGGWTVKDTGTSPYTIPAGTTIAANGYLVLDEAQFGFGLGGADSVILSDSTGTVVESYSWTTHATRTYGRCKDGVGDFKDTKAPTKGATNSCPGLETAPWPGSQDVTTADLPGTFVQDLSGLTFDPADPDVLWAAQNKKGTLFKLVRDASNTWVPAPGWPKDPKYAATPNSVNGPDTEGLTIGPDGFVYLASERDNDASGTSRMSILRYDPNATGSTITPTNEWVLTSQIPAAGANLGLEGVAFVPDSYLVGNGFKDQSTNATYDPASYPNHGSGLYFVAVEDTGDLIGFALDSDGVTSHKIVTIDSGFEHLADVTFDPERQRLWAVTDDTHDGRTSQLKIDASGAFVVDTAFDRPLNMPNLNNEGLAIAPQSRCVAGKKEVLWSDDGDTGGNSIRRGSINCVTPVAQTVTITSTPPASPAVGQMYPVTATGSASGTPVVVSIDAASAGVCSLIGILVTFDHPGDCVIRATQAASPGFLAGQATQTVTVAKAGQSITFDQPADTTFGGAGVPLTATATSGLTVTFSSETPAVCSVSGTTVQPLAGGTCTVTASQAGNGDFTAAAPMSRSLTVAKAAQTITFAQPGNTTFSGASVPLTGSSSSGLPVTFGSQTPAVCVIDGATAKPVGAGTCTVTATQPGNGNYAAAAPASRSLTVAKAPVVVTTKSTSGLLSLLTLKITYTSTVKSAITGLPVAGVTVTTRVNGGSPTSGCTAVTNASGVATCTVGPISIALGVTYTATAAESANHRGGTGSAFIGLL